MTKHTSKPVALAFAAALTVPYLQPVAAQTPQAGDSQAGDSQAEDSQAGDPGQVVEEVVVVGERRAYQGNFEDLEKPSADQTIDETCFAKSVR